MKLAFMLSILEHSADISSLSLCYLSCWHNEGKSVVELRKLFGILIYQSSWKSWYLSGDVLLLNSVPSCLWLVLYKQWFIRKEKILGIIRKNNRTAGIIVSLRKYLVCRDLQRAAVGKCTMSRSQNNQRYEMLYVTENLNRQRLFSVQKAWL